METTVTKGTIRQHIYLAEAADHLDLNVSGRENISDGLGLLGLSGGGWL